ncbi:hypothetical protein [Pseudomonas protegens]|uniref:hypothetical protein n=1 Tax=Pseudomonas protegens TaxID=380021 RepID=UPI003839D59D
MYKIKEIHLKDKNDNTCGEIKILKIFDNLIEGELIPTSNFEQYTSLFCEHEHAANHQLLIETDRLERDIEALGFYIEAKYNLSTLQFRAVDLQIMSSGVTLKIEPKT